MHLVTILVHYIFVPVMNNGGGRREREKQMTCIVSLALESGTLTDGVTRHMGP